MEFTLPDLGENIEEAEVLNVLVKKGDAVAKDQLVLEMETDKATFELPCPQAGTVSAIHVKKGDTVRIGQKILTLEAGSPGRKGKEKKAADGAQTAVARKQERGESEPPEDKDTEKTGTTQEDPQEDATADAEVAAGPATRRLARELEVDLVRLRGTGSGGRITPEDVQAFVRARATAPAATAAAPAATAAAPQATDIAAAPAAAAAVPAAETERWGPVERRPLSGIEKAAARHLSASWSEIPHVTHHDLADVTELEAARVRYESGRKESAPKVTWTALVVKAVVAALRAFPRVNSSLDAARGELVIKRDVHVGIAVDTEHGLLVPVLREADRKTTREIAAEITRLAERARDRKLAPEEMQGASFTVTNLGGIGGVAFTPIISRPEVAILGVSRSRPELTLRDGQPVQRLMLPLSLSYDHRVINGADAARFVRHVADLLEHPMNLLLES